MRQINLVYHLMSTGFLVGRFSPDRHVFMAFIEFKCTDSCNVNGTFGTLYAIRQRALQKSTQTDFL